LALASLEADNLTRAHRTNREYTKADLQWNTKLTAPIHEAIIYDPQTSGGLLLSVDPLIASELLGVLKHNFKAAQTVGRVVSIEGAQSPSVVILE
jgi:hypothetical protein